MSQMTINNTQKEPIRIRPLSLSFLNWTQTSSFSFIKSCKEKIIIYTTNSVTYQFKIFKICLLHNRNWPFWVLQLHCSETKIFLLSHYDIYISWECLSKAMFFLQNHNSLKGSYRSLWNGVGNCWTATMMS